MRIQIIIATMALATAATAGPAAVFTPDGRLEVPKDYRTWVYLSTGMDMSYTEGVTLMHMFDNVFVDPAAYAAFQKSGTWPDGTVFVLEARGAAQKGSINKRGSFQTGVMAMEAHVKDTARFKSGWAFFPISGEAPAKALPQDSGCNACHEAHAAVDTTFVQFYPTLLPIATAKGKLSAAYLAEEKVK